MNCSWGFCKDQKMNLVKLFVFIFLININMMVEGYSAKSCDCLVTCGLNWVKKLSEDYTQITTQIDKFNDVYNSKNLPKFTEDSDTNDKLYQTFMDDVVSKVQTIYMEQTSYKEDIYRSLRNRAQNYNTCISSECEFSLTSPFSDKISQINVEYAKKKDNQIILDDSSMSPQSKELNLVPLSGSEENPHQEYKSRSPIRDRFSEDLAILLK